MPELSAPDVPVAEVPVAEVPVADVPVPEVPVAELVRCHKTSDAAVEVVKGFAKRLGKEVIEINESIGLVNPRALLSLINEAAYMLDEGVGDTQSIEKLIKDSCGIVKPKNVQSIAAQSPVPRNTRVSAFLSGKLNKSDHVLY